MGKHCRRLKELYVGSCFGISDDGIQAVLKGCGDLEELDISRCYLVSDDSLKLAIVYPNKLSLVRLTGCLKVCMCNHLITAYIVLPVIKNLKN